MQSGTPSHPGELAPRLAENTHTASSDLSTEKELRDKTLGINS